VLAVRRIQRHASRCNGKIQKVYKWEIDQKFI